MSKNADPNTNEVRLMTLLKSPIEITSFDTWREVTPAPWPAYVVCYLCADNDKAHINEVTASPPSKVSEEVAGNDAKAQEIAALKA